MKYSQLFGKPKKDAKAYDTKNATYLIKGGFVDQTMSGVYKYLPLGLKVLNKIEQIVRQEMDQISQEMLLSALSPRELWETTNRAEIDVLFEARGANEASRMQNDSTYILNPTHEDNITPLVQRFAKSYKEFPIALYQIQNKFRNEARAKSGVLRGREFRMKDLYSFHTNLEDLMDYYEIAKQAYVRVFERLGIGDSTVIALASGGDFTENYSHEFQTFCDAGEDTIFFDETENIWYNREVTPAKAPAYKYDTEMKPRKDVFGENIVSVEKLVEFLKIPIETTIKTLIYTSKDQIYAVAVRGDYEVDEGKLKKVTGKKDLQLADAKTIKQITGAEVGYAGILDLPESVEVICDEALSDMVNFEVGANKTNYHTVNANWGRDITKPSQFFDIKVAKDTDLNPKTGKPYQIKKAAEVGNIFPLETKFSKAFNFKYVTDKGKEEFVYMGSYGIGTTRLVGVIAEIMSDDKGLVWPKQVAPYQVHLISLGKKSEESYLKAEELYQNLKSKGIDILWDDREDASAGEKFADADLIGVPTRLVLSKKTLAAESVELKQRTDNDSKMVKLDQILEFDF